MMQNGVLFTGDAYASDVKIRNGKKLEKLQEKRMSVAGKSNRRITYIFYSLYNYKRIVRFFMCKQ